jgi:hypothetical protein
MVSDKEDAHRQVEELTAAIGVMASFIGARFIPDKRKTDAFIAAQEERARVVREQISSQPGRRRLFNLPLRLFNAW